MLKKGNSLRDVATGEVLRVVDVEPCYGEGKEMVMLAKVGVRRDKVELTGMQRKIKAEIYRQPPRTGKSFLIAHLYEHDEGARKIVSDKEAAEDKEKLEKQTPNEFFLEDNTRLKNRVLVLNRKLDLLENENVRLKELLYAKNEYISNLKHRELKCPLR